MKNGLTKIEKQALEKAAQLIEKTTFSCTAIDRAQHGSYTPLRSAYTEFFNAPKAVYHGDTYYALWEGLLYGTPEATLQRQLMILLFAEVGPEGIK